MISPAVLEAPGAWRKAGVAFGLAAVLAAPLSLALPQLADPQFFQLGSGFGGAIIRSAGVGAAAAILGLAAGLLVGLPAGLYAFPFRRPVLAALALPLIVPPFLWAIGLSAFRIRMGLDANSLLSGASGSALAFTAFTAPLVALATVLAVSGLSRTQVEAARAAGGEWTVLLQTARAVLPVATIAALLGGVLTLSEAGPGQILGFRGVAAEILTSFAARYDFNLAARQSLALAGVVLLTTASILVFFAQDLAHGLLARTAEPVRRVAWQPARYIGPSLSVLIIGGTLAAPFIGLGLPALEGVPWDRAFETVGRTAANTFLYALLAGAVAATLGFGLALAAGRERSLRHIVLVGLVAIFVLPPALGALGALFVASGAPSWLDPLLRSRLTVGVVLGLRLVPIPAVLALRALDQMPRSWAQVAAVHGVSLKLYAMRVLVPFLGASFALGVVLAALLAISDVGTVLLVQPPGESSLPVSIFTVMANAPESLVAGLCLLYIAMAAAIAGFGAVALPVFETRRLSTERRENSGS